MPKTEIIKVAETVSLKPFVFEEGKAAPPVDPNKPAGVVVIEKKREEEVKKPEPVLPTKPVPITAPINPATGFQGAKPEPDFGGP